MSGVVSFKAKVYVPPEERPFLKKVELQGDFGIDAGSVAELRYATRSQQPQPRCAEGKNHKTENEDADPQNVLSDLRGHVLLRNGIATFRGFSFGVPGALAQMRGTYNLNSERIDLRGTLKTEAEISKTAHGIKALMLKVLDLFLENGPSGYVAPVKITGTYDHPSFGLDLGDRDNKKKKQNAKVRTPQLTDQAKHH
jgi:hypothetical protein